MENRFELTRKRVLGLVLGVMLVVTSLLAIFVFVFFVFLLEIASQRQIT